ncbi:19046_t:CDS:1, partial [Funneliformis geosporum]
LLIMERITTKTIKKTLTNPQSADYEALSIAKYLFSLDPQRDYFNDKRKISTGTGFSSVLL